MVTACNSGVAVIDALQASCLNLAQDLYLGLSGDKMIAIVAKKVKDHRANVSGEKNKKEDSHLWCSFLVSIAQGIDSFSGSNIQDRTYLGGVVAGKLGNSGIICSYDADRKPRVEGKVSDRLWEAVSVEVTDHVVDAIMTAAMGGLEARTLSMLLRIIALFVCPNAAAHPVVFKECLGTLLKLVPIEDLVVEMAEIVVP